MPKALIILQRVLVNYFYQVNAGFFLFGFFVLFGLPYSPVSFHLSLIKGILQSGVFLALVMLGWLLYNYKCINYVVKQLKHPRHNLLFSINSLSPQKVYLYMLYVQTLVYLPVLLYAVAIVWQASKTGQYMAAGEVIFFNAIIITATSLIYVSAIQKRTIFSSGSLLPAVRLPVLKPFFLLPLYFLWNERKQMLLVTKVFSLALLYAFIKLFEPERYDIRPLQLCLLLTAASHSAIVFEIQNFEEEYLSFSKNLPFTIVKRFLNMLAMYCCLLLPELVFLFKGWNVHFIMQDYPQLLLMLLALVSLFHSILLLENTNMDQLIRIVFGIMAVCFFILLYNPGVVLPVAILLLAFALYSSYFYNYEKEYST